MSKTLTPACLISLTLIGCGPDYASVADGERRVVVDAGTSEFYDTGVNAAPTATTSRKMMTTTPRTATTSASPTRTSGTLIGRSNRPPTQRRKTTAKGSRTPSM